MVHFENSDSEVDDDEEEIDEPTNQKRKKFVVKNICGYLSSIAVVPI